MKNAKYRNFRTENCFFFFRFKAIFKDFLMIHIFIQDYEKQMSVYGVPVQPIKAEEIPSVEKILEDQKAPNLQDHIKQVI